MLLGLVDSDSSISDSHKFYISPDGTHVKKQKIGDMTTFTFDSLLLGLWHYAVQVKNHTGNDTCEVLFPRKGNSPRTYDNDFHNSVRNITIKYLSSGDVEIGDGKLDTYINDDDTTPIKENTFLFGTDGDNCKNNRETGVVTDINGHSPSIVLNHIPQNQSPTRLNFPMSDHYNLFVHNEIDFDDEFSFSMDRVLTRSTDKDVNSMFVNFSEESIQKLKQFPAIFANENTYDRNQFLALGYIKEIELYNDSAWITPDFQLRLLQLPFSYNLDYFRLTGQPNINELRRTHWTVKKANLIKKLQKEYDLLKY